MSYREQVSALTPEVVAGMKRALETGRWPDGRALSAEQREHCMSAVILWDAEHLPEEARTGFIDRGHKDGEQCDDDVEQPLRWAQEDDSRE